MILSDKIYKDECWWCGSIADTKEHIYKKSDFELLFGKTDFTKDDEPVIMDANSGEITKSIQGSKSRYLKYENPNLCSHCNNSRSVNMDKSYQKVIQYVFENHERIVLEKEIDFKKIFPEDYKKQKIEFHKYCLKHIACRIASNDFEVPQSIINFLDGDIDSRAYNVKFRIRHDMHYLLTKFDIGLKFMHTRTLQKLNIKQDGVKIGEGVISIYFLQWLRIIIIYSELFINNKLSEFENPIENVQLTAFNQNIDISSLTIKEKEEFILWSIDKEKGMI